MMIDDKISVMPTPPPPPYRINPVYVPMGDRQGPIIGAINLHVCLDECKVIFTVARSFNFSFKIWGVVPHE